MIPTKPRANRALLPLALALLAAAPSAAQQRDASGRPLTAEELRQIHCAAMQIPQVRTSVQNARPPILIVSGREQGTVRAPQGSCPAGTPLPGGAQEIRYVRPHAAAELYGPRGENGAVLIDVGEAVASAQGGRSRA